ncbi:MAG: transposase [Leptospiraceae bacterium]|nr:MAG: transposase [Leptospiraceae bacterium]
MYKKRDKNQLELENFYLPFSGKLNKNNRWVLMAKQIPWEELEENYANLFSENKGAPAKSFRMALGALLIKQKLGLSDEETVEQIRENPYLQYFIGLSEYQYEAPFDASMLVYFRKRINSDMLEEINEIIIKNALSNKKKEEESKEDKDNDNNTSNSIKSEGGEDLKVKGGKQENKGILMLDASVIPADISYPTDLDLLNESREKLERVIDKLYENIEGKLKKPRTYRERARKEYLSAVLNKKISRKSLKKAIKKQIQYIKRDLNHIESLLREGGKLSVLTRKEYRDLLVINEIYRQQKYMYEKKTNKIEHRIVSIHQPYIRPMIRGKKSAKVEFGPKIIVSRIEGYHIIEKISWDNINEAKFLQEQIERYKLRTGYYPEAVLADQLFKTKENVEYCKERHIRFTGKRLSRKKREEEIDKKIVKQDQSMRNAIEGFFGVIKRKYGLDRLMNKLKTTSETTISLVVLLRNLEKLVNEFFSLLVNTILFSKFSLYFSKKCKNLNFSVNPI